MIALNKSLVVLFGSASLITVLGVSLEAAQAASLKGESNPLLKGTTEIVTPAVLPAGIAAFTYVRNGIVILGAASEIIKSINAVPVTGIVPPLAINFNESNSFVELTVTGGDFDTDSTQTFNITGFYWNGTLTVSQAAGLIVDALTVSGTLSHILGPHDNDGLGRSSRFLAGWAPPAKPSFTIDPQTEHPNNSHSDNFKGSLGGTSTATDITTWNVLAEGVHVPEPSDFYGPTVFGLLMGGGYLLKRKRKLKQIKISKIQ